MKILRQNVSLLYAFVVWFVRTHSRSPEQELHVLGCELLKCLALIFVDGSVDHICFLLLEENHSGLDGVFDAESGDHAGTLLADTVASVGALPFGCWVPPSKEQVS